MRNYLVRLLFPGFALFFLFSNAQPVTNRYKLKIREREYIFSNPPFKQCHASSLVELSGGNIMAVWFGGTYERHPDVSIWGSVRSADGWSSVRLLADGRINDTLRYPCWNPVLFKLKNGDLLLFYKIGPSPDTWHGMYKISHDEGQTWSSPVELAGGIIGPAKNKPVYVAGGKIISPSSVENRNIWNACMEISDDDGKTWNKIRIDTTTGYKLIQPALLTLNNGTLLALMRSDQNCVVASRSTDNGNTWSVPEKTAVRNPNSGIDAVTLTNGLHILVYNPSVSGKEWFEGRSKLVVAASADGIKWQDTLKLEDLPSGEYSYPAIIQTSDGLIHVTYTYNRVNIRHVVLSAPVR